MRTVLSAVLVALMAATAAAAEPAAPDAKAPEAKAADAKAPEAKAPDAKPAAPAFDAALAQRVGADAHGMRAYVLVILKSGPQRMPEGEARKAMFAGHFANMERLSEQGKLVVAGPFAADPDGWRGLFVFAVKDIEEARALTATDPVIANGEMVAEYHRWYGSAANMLIPELHKQVTAPGQP
ncbi:YciI family protein [Lysobacter enzymogenes]|uniref:YciI family protein n=1 Tax=Lysobacter enzymogenes TaxID=69 RepID=UPI00384BEE92